MIPAEAVDAAAKALYKGQPIYDEAEGVITGYKPWEWMEPAHQDAMLAEARAALEAAAPRMLAQAWDQGESAGQGNYGRVVRRKTNPYRS